VTSTVRAGAAVGLSSGVTDFADWVRPHLPAMARLAARLAPHADRDDVVQEALARAWAKRDRFDERRGSASAWLLAITADQAAKARRRRPRVAGLSEATVLPAAPDDVIDIERALRQLPRRQRMAIDCYYFVGLSVAETAAVMGCAEGTVKSTLADARARLRPLLRGFT
jgi:RNA polymerase sigma factor (sigma-70 family)